MSEEVKNKRIEDGVYQFSYKAVVKVIRRRPDLYFDLDLDGTLHKGYMKDLKAKFKAWVDGGAVSLPIPPASKPVELEVVVALPANYIPPARKEDEPTAVRQAGVVKPHIVAKNPKRAYAHFFWRVDHKSGRKTHETGIDVYAKFANGGFDDVYPNVRTAMAEATKEKPMDNGHAFFYPDLME